jgi:hypothetical protein
MKDHPEVAAGIITEATTVCSSFVRTPVDHAGSSRRPTDQSGSTDLAEYDHM